MAWLRAEGLLAAPRSTPRPSPRPSPPPAPASPRGSRRIVATFPYHEEANALLFEVVKYDPKDFRQRQPDGRGGWISNIDNVRRVPYRLPELLKAVAAGETIYVVEGEKDVDNLRAIGLAATCNPGGVRKWRAEYSDFLRSADVVVITDNDAPGREHGCEMVATSLRGIAKRIRILDIGKHWPDCPDKGDISDWLTAGGDAAKLKAMVADLGEATITVDKHHSQQRPLSIQLHLRPLQIAQL